MKTTDQKIRSMKISKLISMQKIYHNEIKHQNGKNYIWHKISLFITTLIRLKRIKWHLHFHNKYRPIIINVFLYKKG